MAIKAVTWNKKLQKLRYLFAFVLFVYIIVLSSTLILNYHVKPLEIYKISLENLIEDGSFENFNQTAGDCCNANPGNASVFASKSLDAFAGKYSLNLTSYNHCACVSKGIKNLDSNQKYFLSFYYKGDNAKVCNLISEEKTCKPNNKFQKTTEWTRFNYLLLLNDGSRSSSLHFYADSSGSQVTNLYDGLRVSKLTELLENVELLDYNEYIIKTKVSHNVNGEMLGDPINGEAYYFIQGVPQITIKFPYAELGLIVVMILIMIRLMLRKKEAWE
ncbi:MAG: hypothetical protein WC781_05240 [Candidatus Pacearchaeota archaeon]|jgi:hypothetical protein